MSEAPEKAAVPNLDLEALERPNGTPCEHPFFVPHWLRWSICGRCGTPETAAKLARTLNQGGERG